MGAPSPQYTAGRQYHEIERTGRCILIETISRNWFFVALCGLLEAILAIVYLVMQGTDGPLSFHAWSGSITFLGELTIAAGGCAIAAGVWRSGSGRCWLLVLKGAALAGLGWIYYALVRFRISILTLMLLVAVTAVSAGILELIIARVFRHQGRTADGWLFGVAGAISIGFTLPMFALGFRLIRLAPGEHLDLLLLGLYFGFSAACSLGLALRLHWPGMPVVPEFRNPTHAH
jgi:hypothetical protein